MSNAKDPAPPCCSVAKALDPKALAKLDAELRAPGHRSFRKLAEALGMVGQKSAIERHKHRCLKVGQGYDVPPVKDPPRGRTVRVEPVPSVPEVSQGQGSGPFSGSGTASVDPLRARAPEAANVATSLPDRMAHIVSQLAAGTWDSARDIPRCAAMWGLAEDSVRHTVRHILAARRLNRGDTAAIEEESVAFYTWQAEDLQATLTDCVEPEEKAKIHARLTEVRERIDAILLGTKPGTIVNLNLGNNPAFVEAARRYVDAVQGVLGAAPQIAARLAETLPGAPPALVSAVLAEAAAMLEERLAPPALPEASA